MQDCSNSSASAMESNSSASAMELLQSCTEPSICEYVNIGLSNGLAANKQQAISWSSGDPDLQHHMAS